MIALELALAVLPVASVLQIDVDRPSGSFNLSISSSKGTMPPPPTLDDLWDLNATFNEIVSFPVNSPALPNVNAGTRIVVVDGTWYESHNTPLSLSL